MVVTVTVPKIVKVCVTLGAAAKLALPAWLAVTAHEPGALTVTVAPETLHAVELVKKITGRLEEAVAATVNGLTGRVTFLNPPKLMLCEAWVMLNVCVTVGATE